MMLLSLLRSLLPPLPPLLPWPLCPPPQPRPTKSRGAAAGVWAGGRRPRDKKKQAREQKGSAAKRLKSRWSALRKWRLPTSWSCSTPFGTSRPRAGTKSSKTPRTTRETAWPREATAAVAAATKQGRREQQLVRAGGRPSTVAEVEAAQLCLQTTQSTTTTTSTMKTAVPFAFSCLGPVVGPFLLYHSLGRLTPSTRLLSRSSCVLSFLFQTSLLLLLLALPPLSPPLPHPPNSF
mmetsp:Transcript_2821/g.5043  ORF Transcript_2821/g.5043 Transcript_2821/m.5043 type:complete len:235 (+) Transcript_2821:474-1178(+)